MPIKIHYEDEFFLIVNKPEGLVVHATLDKKRENLYDILRDERPNQYLGLHHRLDKETSGLMLFTKNQRVNHFVQDGFLHHSILKKYFAIVHGSWILENEVLEDFLKKEMIARKEKMIRVFKGGQKAITFALTLKHNHQYSLMDFTLKTGRMHQLRVQSSLRNHPLVGDRTYGDLTDSGSRLMLHSYALSFEFEGKKIEIIDDLPQAFANFF